MLLAAGCELINIDHTQTNLKPALTPVVGPRDGIELEVYFIERPVQDPLLGAALWSEVDQINCMDQATQARLNRAGLRCGVASAPPPFALQALVSSREFASAAQQTRIQPLTLLSGQDTELQTALLPQTFHLEYPLAGLMEQRDYATGRCVLRVTGDRVQEGWVRLEFLPEVHHGQRQVRTVASDHEWQFQDSQQIDPLYEQRFAVEANEGEMIVIGATGNEPHSVGRWFLRGGAARPTTERIVIVRVRGMRKIEPVRRETR
jgi:hypothetical protein